MRQNRPVAKKLKKKPPRKANSKPAAKAAGGTPRNDAAANKSEIASIATLLRTRPDLAIRDFTSTAQLRAAAASNKYLAHCRSHLDKLDLSVLDTLGAIGSQHPITIAQLAGGIDVATVEASLERLADRWLVTRTDNATDGERWQPVPSSLNGRSANLGRPFTYLARGTSPDAYRAGLKFAGIQTKNEDDTALRFATWLSNPANTQRLIDTAPPGAKQLALRLATGTPTTEAASYYGQNPKHSAVGWLERHGLLFREEWNSMEFPAEACIALRGATVFGNVETTPPLPTTADAVPAVGAEIYRATNNGVAAVDQLCRSIESLVVKGLKSGGIGVRDVRRIATENATDELTTTRLLELAGASGLILIQKTEITPAKRSRGRTKTPAEYDCRLVTTTLYQRWRTQTIGQRWLHLTRSWMSTPSHLSANRHENAPNVLDDEAFAPIQMCRRFAFLQSMASLDQKSVTNPITLVPFVRWHAWEAFETNDGDHDVFTSDLSIIDFFEEATLLGAIVDGALTSVMNPMMQGDFDAAAQLVDDFAPPHTDEITLQSNGTIVVAGTPSPALLQDLERFAQTTSRDAAYILTITEASLRHAFDTGVEVSQIVDTLERHAPKGIPKALHYLIEDVGRRYGHITVTAATSIAVANDAGVAADIVRNKALAKLGCRLIGSTVVICDAAPDVLLNTLRTAGFLPIADSTGTLSIAAATTANTAAPEAHASYERLVTAHVYGGDIESQARDIAERTQASDVAVDHYEAEVTKALYETVDIDESVPLAFSPRATTRDDINSLVDISSSTDSLIAIARRGHDVNVYVTAIQSQDSVLALDPAMTAPVVIRYLDIEWVMLVSPSDGLSWEDVIDVDF